MRALCQLLMFLLFICDYQTHDHSTIAMIIKLVLLRITFSLKSGRAMSKTHSHQSQPSRGLIFFVINFDC